MNVYKDLQCLILVINPITASLCSADMQLYTQGKYFIKDNCKLSIGLSFILITHI